MSQELTAAQLAGIAKVEKIMALAAGNANENEAANATAMASALLVSLNLSMDDLKGKGANDERSKDNLLGGFYQHERDMWSAISLLNFCVYSTVKITYNAEKAKKEGRKYAHHHRVIGRTVNILGTKLMAEYLLTTLERLTREYCVDQSGSFMPRNSMAVSFRKGAAERLIEKINRKRWEMIAAEKAAETERAASGAGGTALVISGLIKSEHVANYDFQYGEGAYARSQLSLANWEVQWAAERKAAEAADAALKLSDPKAWAAKHKPQKQRAYRERREPQFKGDSRAFGAGYRAAESVSLDRQIDRTAQGRLK